jgi:uncharacterized phiE125 gp8 family phage protein
MGVRLYILEKKMNQIPYLNLIAAPQIEPITLTEIKLYLRIDSNDENNLLNNLIKAASQTAEEFLGKSLITQTWQLQYDYYTPACVNLPRGPVQEIAEVNIVAADFNVTTLAPSAYRLSAGNAQIIFEAAPMGQLVQIQYIAGFGDAAADVPEPIRQGIAQHVAHMYENRGLTDLPISSRGLYSAYKTIRM